MHHAARSFAILLCLGGMCPGQPPADNLGTPPAAPVAPLRGPGVTKSESGLSLVVPAEQRSMGTVYHNAPTAAKQVSFISEALHAKFSGHSNGVIGYAVAGAAESPAALRAGAWVVPVKSLTSGNKLRDKHTGGPDWLDAAKYPDITFVLKSVRDIKAHKESAAGRSYTATLVGDMTLHGVTREISVPDAVLGFVNATDKSPLKGDLLAIRCKYTVRLSDYGISNEYTTKLQSVADEIQIDQALMLSTVAPEQQAKPEPASEDDGK